MMQHSSVSDALSLSLQAKVLSSYVIDMEKFCTAWADRVLEPAIANGNSVKVTPFRMLHSKIVKLHIRHRLVVVQTPS